MAKNTGDPRGPGMPGSGGWFPATTVAPEPVTLGRTRDVDLSFGCYAPQLGLYVAEDDVLQLQQFQIGGQALNLQYRILRPDGTVLVSQDVVNPPGARVGGVTSRQLAEGILLSVCIFPAGIIVSGTYSYCMLGLRRQNLGSTSQFIALAAGYVTQACALSWPGHTLQRPTDGSGIIRSITGTVPAAGADINEVVPANTRWRLLSLFAQLTTAVAVANRQVNLTLDDGVNIFYETPNGPVQAASLVWEYNFAPLGFAPAVVLTDVAMHYDNGQILGPGFRIRTDTVNLQAADQWTAPQYAVLEWQDNA